MFVVMTDVHMSARHMCTLHTRGWVGEIRCTPSVLRVEDEEVSPGRSIRGASAQNPLSQGPALQLDDEANSEIADRYATASSGP